MMRYLLVAISSILFTFYIRAQSDSILQYELDIPVEIQSQRSYIDQQVKLERSHFLTYPAAFEDPARLLIKYPGFATSNDQANEIIYNGMPAKYTRWSMYGADIINPNHLSTAGTASGLGSPSGGGVNIFSAQVIKSLEYLSSPSSDNTNSTAGNAALSLRDPYKDRWHLNASLVGIELGRDQIVNNTKIMANYRYSTVGIITGLGADFGGEKINYQDGVFKIDQDSILSGKLSYFISWGRSNNDVSLDDLSTEEIFELSDLEASTLDESNLITGLNYSLSHPRLILDFASNFSTKKTSLSADTRRIIPQIRDFIEHGYDFNTEDRLWSNKLKVGQKTSFGSWIYKSRINLLKEDIFYDFYELNSFYQQEYSSVVDRRSDNYLESVQSLTFMLDKYLPVDIQLGISHHYQTKKNQSAWLPSFSISKNWNRHNLYGKYARTAQIIGIHDLDNSTVLGQHLSLGWEFNTLNTTLSASVNRHQIEGTNTDYFYIRESSLFDPFKPLESSAMVNTDSLSTRESIVTINAINLLASHRFQNNYFVSVGGSYIHHEEESTSMHKSPSVPDYIFNILLKKSFPISDSKTLGISTSYYRRAAFRQKRQTIYYLLSNERAEASAEYDTQTGSYNRADFRIYYVKNMSNKKVVWSLDIQNKLNNKNGAYSFYDFVADGPMIENQLGLIGILSYRLSF